MLRATGFLLLLLLLLPGPVAAQSDSEWIDDCMDDNGLERCDPDVHARLLELYGVQSIEALNEQEVWVRRAFFVDGYGRDVALISFLRRPGESPMLEVLTPRRTDGTQWPVMRTDVPPEIWGRVIYEDRFFDRDLVVPAQDDGADAPIVICVHAWLYVVEASDPERRQLNTAGVSQSGLVRRDVEDACSDGLAEPYATLLSELASGILPFCAPDAAEYFRNAATRLAACAVLSGDRMTASELMQATRILDLSPQYFRDDIGRLFGTRARLHRPDDPPGSEGTRARQAWIALLTERRYSTLLFDRIHGENADRGVMEGEWVASEAIEGEDRIRWVAAPVVLRWDREYGNLKIVDAEIGEFVESTNPFRR